MVSLFLSCTACRTSFSLQAKPCPLCSGAVYRSLAISQILPMLAVAAGLAFACCNMVRYKLQAFLVIQGLQDFFLIASKNLSFVFRGCVQGMSTDLLQSVRFCQS